MGVAIDPLAWLRGQGNQATEWRPDIRALRALQSQDSHRQPWAKAGVRDAGDSATVATVAA
jgi:hypothetical protein